jgi:AcrR family transcriptional regulator
MSLERKKMKRKQKREEIISTAEKLFFSKGYDDVSMNDIAKDVGMSKATLYLYFDNKDSLFFAVVLRGAEIMKSLIEKEMENVEMGIDKMKLIAFTSSLATESRSLLIDFISHVLGHEVKSLKVMEQVRKLCT